MVDTTVMTTVIVLIPSPNGYNDISTLIWCSDNSCNDNAERWGVTAMMIVIKIMTIITDNAIFVRFRRGRPQATGGQDNLSLPYE